RTTGVRSRTLVRVLGKPAQGSPEFRRSPGRRSTRKKSCSNHTPERFTSAVLYCTAARNVCFGGGVCNRAQGRSAARSRGVGGETRYDATNNPHAASVITTNVIHPRASSSRELTWSPIT